MTPDTFPAALVEALATVITDAVAECDNGPGLYPHEARQIATAALSALPAAVQAVARGEAVAQVWQPIATAPTGDAGTRDAPDVLVYASQAHGLRGFMAVTHWHPDAGWCVDEWRAITHWMPLPAAPAQEPHGASVHPTTKETDK